MISRHNQSAKMMTKIAAINTAISRVKLSPTLAQNQMTPDDYFLYLLVAIGYIASPGPAVFLAINGGARLGVKKTAITLFGNTAGLGVLAFVSASGLGALVLNSPIALQALKICGALWLAYLGVRMLLSNKFGVQNNNMNIRKHIRVYGFGKLLMDGFLLAVTNPKPIVFFLSIYPQFIVLNGNEIRQFLWLGISFLTISFVLLNCYAIFSRFTVGQVLTRNGIKWFNILFGITFIVLAASLLFSTTH